MKTLLIQSLCALFLAESAQAQSNDKAKTQEQARERIIRKAPIVFLGRPLQGQSYEDASGRIYESTVIQVLDVLRGNKLLKTGTVEFIDSLVQTPELRAWYRFGGTNVYERDYGVYFAAPSTYPAQREPYHTTNGKLQLKPFGSNPQAKVLVSYGSHGSIVEGLYLAWSTEPAMLEYINKLPKLRPVAQLGNERNYPYLYFHDKRHGGRDIYPPAVADTNSQPVIKEIISDESQEPTTEPASAKFLPLDAFNQLPGVMQKIRTNQVLTEQDSVFIKTWLPEYLLKKPGPKKPESVGP